MSMHVAQSWMTPEHVHALAGRRPRDLGTVLVSKKNTRAYRVVLSARPKKKGRKKLGRNGMPRRSTADRQRRAAAREPWVLATSLCDPARVIVEAYGNAYANRENVSRPQEPSFRLVRRGHSEQGTEAYRYAPPHCGIRVGCNAHRRARCCRQKASVPVSGQ